MHQCSKGSKSSCKKRICCYVAVADIALWPYGNDHVVVKNIHIRLSCLCFAVRLLNSILSSESK